jgi:hypothetical protein
MVKGLSSVTAKCFALGMYIDKAKKGVFAPGFGMHRYCTDAKDVSSVFRMPVSYTLGAGIGGHSTLWLVNCPAGFVSLGSVGIHKNVGVFNKDFPAIRCINYKYVVQTAYVD